MKMTHEINGEEGYVEVSEIKEDNEIYRGKYTVSM